MPSHDHEVPVELFRNQPALAPELLRSVFDMKLPSHAEACLSSETLNSLDPAEFRCDAAVLLKEAGRAAFGIVVERQMEYKKRKEYTWPVYLTTFRARHECPVSLLVMCPDATTAAACAKPIETGHPGWVLEPLVLSPDQLPAITDPAQARRRPELAVLSTPAHAEGPQARAVLTAFCEAVEASGSAGPLYHDYVASQLSAATRKLLEEIVSAGTYEWKSEFALKHRAEGEAKGEARMLLLVLAARGIAVSDEVRERITSCTDLDQLEAWAERAATADSAEEIFNDPRA